MTNNYNDIYNRVKAMQDDDGCTLKHYNFVEFKTGWQVATEGVEVDTPEEVMQAVKKYNGNCGVWLSPKTHKYCVDLSHREKTKKVAMAIGRDCHQETILRWRDMKCIDVK